MGEDFDQALRDHLLVTLARRQASLARLSLGASATHRISALSFARLAAVVPHGKVAVRTQAVVSPAGRA